MHFIIYLSPNSKPPDVANSSVLNVRYFEDKASLFQLIVMHGSRTHGLSHNYILAPLNTAHTRTLFQFVYT